ncbi:tetratricopeptide repeat protein [candidate division KSB1 bacterium]|nr:tetratricopeptide repeat protein [candidate division KSB1 bacterium]
MKTTASGYDRKVISSLFKDGVLLHTDEIEYQSKLHENAIRSIVKSLHDSNYEKFNSLFQLSREYENDTNADIANLIGMAYIRLNLIDEAINEFERIIKLVPDAGKAYFNLGQAYRLADENQKAYNAFEKAVTLKPDFADYHNEFAKACLELGKCKHAAVEFNKALSINIYFAEAYYNLGLTYIKNSIVKDDYDLSANVHEKTKETFAMAIKINPAYKSKLFDEGLHDFENDNHEDALKKLLQAREQIKQNNIQGIINEFYLNFLKDRKEIDIIKIWSYLKDLQALVQKYPNYADLNEELGIAFSIMGIFFNVEAIQYFETALQLNPNFKDARKNMQLLKNENRGLQFLLDAMVQVTKNHELEKHRKLTIKFSE